MLRRLLPYIVCFLLVFVDSSVIPVFTSGAYVFPLALVNAVCAGLALGRTHGLLCALMGGLMTDIIVGTPLGYMMLAYMACGFFAGFFGFDSDEIKAADGYSPLRAQFRRLFVVFALLILFECVTFTYQYFHTAHFMAVYIWQAIFRAAIWTLVINALYWPIGRLYLGKNRRRLHIGAQREVKNL